MKSLQFDPMREILYLCFYHHSNSIFRVYTESMREKSFMIVVGAERLMIAHNWNNQFFICEEENFVLWSAHGDFSVFFFFEVVLDKPKEMDIRDIISCQPIKGEREIERCKITMTNKWKNAIIKMLPGFELFKKAIESMST